jgi:XTP/dITP diphosphohydrolase
VQLWVLASGNQGKQREFAQLLAPLQIQLQMQTELNVVACDEPFDTFLENSLHKARNASAQTGLPALADDSGICVPALHGAPGVRSARFAAQMQFSQAGISDVDQLNNLALQAALEDCEDRTAFYVCVLVLVRHANDPQPSVAQASWWGQLTLQPQGASGFGYDPYFYLPDQGCTAAQLSAAEKNSLSHRAKAMRHLVEQLQSELANANHTAGRT